LNAWVLGWADIPGSREARMMALNIPLSTLDRADAPAYAAKLHVFTREYEQAEALAAQALELTEQYQFPMPGEISRCRTAPTWKPTCSKSALAPRTTPRITQTLTWWRPAGHVPNGFFAVTAIAEFLPNAYG
jgi:hypothetical protein